MAPREKPPAYGLDHEFSVDSPEFVHSIAAVTGVPSLDGNQLKVYNNGIQLYGELLEAGIEIYEYNRTMLHHKTMVVDELWSTVGTTNFDSRSFALNEESSLCIYDREVAAEFEKIFVADLEACARIDLKTWKERGLWTRARGALALILKEQI